MSEKKRGRRRKDEYVAPGEQQEQEKPSKDEIKVAKWMKKNVKTKRTKFMNHNVEYFTANKAIDALLKSKFAEGDNVLFQTREQVVEFLDLMLEHKFYHRAKKVPITLEELKGVTGKDKEKSVKAIKDDKPKTKDKDKEKDKDKDKEKDNNGGTDRKDTEAELSCTHCCEDNGASGDKKEKRKRKIRLDMHPEQVFVDGSEAYVWIYDPIPIHYWIYGLILLLGAIGICLFPLWPSMLRKGVYYLSVASAGFLVFILALLVVRYIIFVIVWILTGSKLHFWIFPNLTEDVGFFASFWPLYESKYNTDDEKTKTSDKRSKAKSKKKEKDSDNDEDACGDSTPLEPEKIEEVKEHDAEMELRHRNVTTSSSSQKINDDSNARNTNTEEDSQSSGADNSEAAPESAKGSRTPSESESEISGKDYEIISESEVQNVK